MKPKIRAARVEYGRAFPFYIRSFLPGPCADQGGGEESRGRRAKKFSDRTPAERYYTEQVRISPNKGADNELLRADANETLQRGWRLVSVARDPSGDSVELVWDTFGIS